MIELQLFDVIEAGSAAAFRASMPAAGDFVLRINSPGGDVFGGLAMFNAIRQHKGKVTAVVDGLAASMASVIAMAADEIVMSRHSMLMIHRPWTDQARGDADDLRKQADLLEKAQAELVEIYSARSGKSADEVAAMLAAETWFTAQEAVDAGFADAIGIEDAEKPRLSARAIEYLATVANDTPAMQACAKRVTDAIRNRADNAFIAGLFSGSQQVQNYLRVTDMNQNPEQFRTGLLATMGQGITPTAGMGHIHAGNGNVVRDSMVDALLTRTGLAQAQEKANPFRIMSMADMARAALTERGVSVHGMSSQMQMIGAAFTHSASDFGNVLMDVANKAMLRGWEQSGETFQQWTKAGTLSDFRTAHRVGLGSFPKLPKVAENAEYTYITTGDKSAPIALATYGALFTISRQAIINDDLSVFTSIPEKLGRAASRTIGDLVYAILTQNAKMPDNVALFHANHGNLLTGNDVAMDPATLALARKQMRLQTDDAGNVLNISPAFMLVPAALEAAAAQLLNSTAVPGAESNSGIANPVHNMGQLIVEPRLDKDSAKQWYLASAQGTDTIEVAYLDGNSTPYIEQQDGFTVDGSAFKVRIDAGVAPLDHRGLLRVVNQN